MSRFEGVFSLQVRVIVWEKQFSVFPSRPSLGIWRASTLQASTRDSGANSLRTLSLTRPIASRGSPCYPRSECQVISSPCFVLGRFPVELKAGRTKQWMADPEWSDPILYLPYRIVSEMLSQTGGVPAGVIFRFMTVIAFRSLC